MKTTMRIILVAILLVLPLNNELFAQDAQPPMPKYISVTTMYWNMDKEDFDNEKWMAGEKEYLEKVTKKNEHILSAGFYTHLYSETNMEIKYVQTYASWDGIDKAAARNVELEKAAWPDKAARDKKARERESYYEDMHSDEIYAPISGAKPMMTKAAKDMVVYVRVSKMAYPDDGNEEEFTSMLAEFAETTINPKDIIKGYYPSVHAWGSDRRDLIEAFYLESTDDLDNLTDGNGDLVKAKWPDEAARKAFFEKYNKYFTGEHGDYIYTYIAELAK
jgi:hypothetical protein